MRLVLLFNILFLVSGCASIKNINKTKELSFEVSNYISNNISYITIPIDETDVSIKLLNAASADSINLHFISHKNIKLNNLKISCMSQCGLNIEGNIDKLYIENMRLLNAHLISNPNIKVNKISIISSEKITTGLPVSVEEARITITSSSDMIEAQKLIKGVSIIPGSGEFIYDTKIIYHNDKPINTNNDAKIPDAVYNIQQLKSAIKDLKWAAPVVSWFVVGEKLDKHNLDVSKIRILPSVESRDEKSEKWYVSKYNRKNAYLISKGLDNRPNYGGAINDASLLRYITFLNENNIKVMFYPILSVDSITKPWRGYIKANNPEDIDHFFKKDDGYNAFILHYAKLLKGKVSAFVIGSEMQDLTQSVDIRYKYPDPRRYPAVLSFIDLAKQVKEILGPDVIVTYAANWSEYHHDNNGFYHLDNLWASEYIDVVGIDSYLPITNKSMGDISINDIKAGWKSGELWDYYYDKNKKEKIMPEFGLKQIEYWWSNDHWNLGIKSDWEKKMKPIWFTEFGFPSMHMATNTPNAFGNTKSVQGGIPKKSSGKPDFAIQMRAIRGTLEYWKDKKEVVENMFLWAWDSRPSIYDPKNIDIWSDVECWARGHWINGKIKPISQVEILDGFFANNIYIDADYLIIDKLKNKANIKMICNNLKTDGFFLKKMSTKHNVTGDLYKRFCDAEQN